MSMMPASTLSQKNFLSAPFQWAEVSVERAGLFDIVRYEREGEMRLVGVVWSAPVGSHFTCATH